MTTVANSETYRDALDSLDVRVLVESLPHMVWVKGPDGATVYLNARGAAFVGLDAEDTYGWSWLDLVHPDDLAMVRLGWEDAIFGGLRYESELRIRNADGRYRWVESRGSPVFGSDGTLENWVGTWTDVDERKRFEAELQTARTEAAQSLNILETLLLAAPIGFGFIDRDCRYVRLNDRLAAVSGIPAAEQIGRTIAESVPAIWPQVEPIYRRALDTGESTLNLEVTAETAEDPGRKHSWLTSYYPVSVGAEVIGTGVIAVDITDRTDAEEALVALTEAAVNAIAAAAEARDPYTAGHQRRVALLSVAIATELGLDPTAVEGIRLAANIHDIGKISIPSEILSKPGRLSASEFALVKEHARAGYDIMKGIAFTSPVAEMILQHHERMDGSGYPSGLIGDEILAGARIIAVADVVEAMTSHRPYRPSKGVTAALSQIEDDRSTLLDAEVVDACLRLFHRDRYAFAE